MRNTKNIILTFAIACIATLGFSQLKVVAPNGDVAIGGITTPTQKVDIDGNLKVRGQNLFVGENAAAGFARVFMGFNRSTAGTSGFDFYTAPTTVAADYQLRLQSNPDGTSRFIHQGGGDFVFDSTDPATEMKFNVGLGAAELVIDNTGYTATGGATSSTFFVNNDAGNMTDIQDYELGLDAVLELNPVTYSSNGTLYANTKQTLVGVTSENLAKVAPESVSSATYIMDEQRRETYESATSQETAIQYMLVNAVKEQQAMIAELTEQVASLQSTIANQEISVQNVELNGTVGALQQNIPNPFGDQTQINYVLPDGTSNASMIFSDANGRVLKNVTLTDLASGTVILKAGELNSGSYTYTLVADGQVVDTKKMVLTK